LYLVADTQSCRVIYSIVEDSKRTDEDNGMDDIIIRPKLNVYLRKSN